MEYHIKIETDGQKERERGREGGRMQFFMKKEDKSLIDVENVVTTGERCCHLSELTNTIEQFMVYVYRNEAYFTYIYEYHTNVFEADNIYKNPPPNEISPIFF